MGQIRITKEDILEDFVRVQKLCPGFSMSEYREFGRYSPKSVKNRCGSFNGAKMEANIPLRRAGRLQPDREARRDRFVKPEAEEDLSGMRRCLNGGEMFLSPDRKAVQNCDKHRRVGEEIVYYGLARTR